MVLLGGAHHKVAYQNSDFWYVPPKPTIFFFYVAPKFIQICVNLDFCVCVKTLITNKVERPTDVAQTAGGTDVAVNYGDASIIQLQAP